MSTVQQLESISATLETYRTHLAAVSHALNALRTVSEQMIEALDRDRAALATHLQLAAESPAVPVIETVDQATPSEEVEVEAFAIDESPRVETEDFEISSGEIELPVEAADPIAPSAEADLVANDIEVARNEDATGNEAEISQEAVAETETEAADATVIETLPEAAPVTGTETVNQVATPEIAADAQTQEPVAQADGNVIALADRRKQRAPLSPARRRAAAVVASLVLCASATFATYEFMQTEMGQQLLQLSSCDGDMLSAQRDCTLLSWLHI